MMMGMDIIESVARQSKEFENKYKLVSFMGHGEPLVNRKLPEMIRKIKAADIAERIDIITNASLLTPEYADELIDAGLDVLRISVQGVTKEAYRKTCNVNIDFKEFVKNIAYFYNNRKQCSIYIKTVDACLEEGEDEIFYDIFSKISQRVYIDKVKSVYDKVSYTDAERDKIRFKGFRTMEEAIAGLLPGWTIKNCGTDMDPGKRDDYRGKKNILRTHPLSREVPCTLERHLDIPANKKTVLKVVVSNHPKFDWELVFRVNGSVQKTVLVGETLTKEGWAEVSFDLTPFAGDKNVQIELENRANGWAFEGGYWAELSVESE
jgi:organic radical activating enzyme